MYKNLSMATIFRIAYAFDMTLAEFLDFPEINDYEFVESECTTLLKDSER